MARTNIPMTDNAATQDAAPVDRDNLKAQLDALGVDYSSRAQTPTLQAMLAAAQVADEPFADIATPENSTPPPVFTPKNAVEAPTVVTKAVSRSKVLIANQHTGPIALPRKGEGNVVLPSIVLPPGQVTAIEGEMWDLYKKQVMIQHYLDQKLLAEVAAVGPVPVMSNTTSNPNVPEHLQNAEEAGEFAAAQVKKQQVGEITI